MTVYLESYGNGIHGYFRTKDFYSHQTYTCIPDSFKNAYNAC